MGQTRTIPRIKNAKQKYNGSKFGKNPYVFYKFTVLSPKISIINPKKFYPKASLKPIFYWSTIDVTPSSKSQHDHDKIN